jgi:hypothetical protein
MLSTEDLYVLVDDAISSRAVAIAPRAARRQPAQPGQSDSSVVRSRGCAFPVDVGLSFFVP